MKTVNIFNKHYKIIINFCLSQICFFKRGITKYVFTYSIKLWTMIILQYIKIF